MYDMEDALTWDAFVDSRMKASGLPVPFYQPKRLGAKPASQRLSAMEHQARMCAVRVQEWWAVPLISRIESLHLYS